MKYQIAAATMMTIRIIHHQFATPPAVPLGAGAAGAGLGVEVCARADDAARKAEAIKGAWRIVLSSSEAESRDAAGSPIDSAPRLVHLHRVCNSPAVGPQTGGSRSEESEEQSSAKENREQGNRNRLSLLGHVKLQTIEHGVVLRS
jgi:hypothetical protein